MAVHVFFILATALQQGPLESLEYLSQAYTYGIGKQ